MDDLQTWEIVAIVAGCVLVAVALEHYVAVITGRLWDTGAENEETEE